MNRRRLSLAKGIAYNLRLISRTEFLKENHG